MNRAVLLSAAVLALALAGGCAGASDDVGAEQSGVAASYAANTTSPAGGTTVGEVVAEAELKPVGKVGVRGTAVFKKVGDLGVQLGLEAANLPKPGAAYYAQIHEGECPNGQGEQSVDGRELGEDHGHEQEHGGMSLPVAMVRLDRLLANVSEEYAHSGHEHAPAAELPGKIDSPISVVSSADATGSVTTLLEGVTPKQIFSGKPKYLDLHAMNSEDAPLLACTDLSMAK